ncbi:MAG: saccharopine dehydrogenase NADP-binding domain-containing protein [Flavobacteriales bacterium]|nr:saccharopine dehydrogenase NADP-binding domain-containing protein [Flavobacteriales bacterium]
MKIHKKILLLGAGRSTASLIDYLVSHLESENWTLKIVERQLDAVFSKLKEHDLVTVSQTDITNETVRHQLISESDIVISMLPVAFHLQIIKDCISLRKPLVTASYITPEIEALTQSAKDAGVVIMKEVGVDPGIDHMSAMKLIDGIRGKGGQILLFESFTGGLIAPESDNNPWNYKFTWNPRNVVIAGQGGPAKFIQEGKYKYIPYNQLFRRTEYMEIEGFGKFEGIANRDSLRYRSVYGLDDIPTLYRGTLRRPGFSRAWDTFVKLGATDDSYDMENVEEMTHREFINSFLAYNEHDSVELKLMHYLNIPQDDPIMDKLKWLGIFERTPVGLSEGTPAQILQHILEKKWTLEKDDKDMLVMWHKIGWLGTDGSKKMMTSSMVAKGEDQVHTSMAKTVGLPVAIATKMILNGTIAEPGIHRPVTPEIYEPILKELVDYGIEFTEKEMTPVFYWSEPE